MKIHTAVEPTPTRLPTPFRVTIVAAGLEYWPLARAANTHLPPEEQISERMISLFATDKRQPSLRQAEVLSRILHRPIRNLFPNLP